MAISSLGTTFAFPGFTAVYTSISVDEPQAEVIDATAATDPIGTKRMVATGDITQPGRIRVDYIRTSQTPAPLTISGLSGVLTISHASMNVSTKAVLESASSEMAVGEMIRGTLNFVVDNSP